MSTITHLSETSPELVEALEQTLAPLFGRDELLVYPLHTGGGCMVCVIDLSIDGRGMGRQIWMTREDDRQWVVGFYDFSENVEDEGICVDLVCSMDFSGAHPVSLADSPLYVAGQIAGILKRLGVSKLQGE